MTAIAILGRTLEYTALVTAFASGAGMRTGQWKAGKTVVDLCAAGRCLSMREVADQVATGKKNQNLQRAKDQPAPVEARRERRTQDGGWVHHGEGTFYSV